MNIMKSTNLRNVKDVQGEDRRVLEAILGEKLHEGQQIFVMVLAPHPSPDESVRGDALADLQKLSAQAAQHAAAEGIEPEEAERIVDEALASVRRHK